MMDTKSKEIFDVITSKPINELTKDDIVFLKARRFYLTPAQRLAYQTAEMDLFKENEEAVVIENVAPVSEDIIEIEDADNEPVQTGVKGMKQKKK